MTTADATPDGSSPPSAEAGPSPDTLPLAAGVALERSPVPPSSPALTASWLLRTAAFGAVASGIMGVIVAPGVRGNAPDWLVTASDGLSTSLSIFLLATLVALVLRGALDLSRAGGIPTVCRVALIVTGLGAVGLTLVRVADRLPGGDRLPASAMIVTSLVVAVVAAAAAIVAAYASARGPHTRAAAGVLFVFALASLSRVAAWLMATRAGDAASLRLFGWSRGLATAGVLFEAAGQLVAVMWLGTRSRWAGHLGAFAAVVGAAVLTWGVANGVHADAYAWQAILHTSLSDAPGVPAPYGLDALATFLVPASLLLALVAASQPKQVVAIVSTMALVLVSRGAFDAPLRALCGVVAAQWAALACVDERAMWRTLLDDRKKRLEEDAL